MLNKSIIDPEWIAEFLKYLQEIVDEGARKIVLDFSHVEYISSEIFRKILCLHRRLLAEQGQLRLCAITKEHFVLGGIFNFLNIDKTLEDSLTALQK